MNFFLKLILVATVCVFGALMNFSEAQMAMMFSLLAWLGTMK